MKVLFIHQHFRYPEEGGAVRSYYLARALVKQGHSTTVITIKNDITAPETENIDGIEVHYLPISYYNKMSFTRRIWAYFSFVIDSISYSKTLEINKFDLCYCISTPLTSGIVGMWLKRKYNLPYLFEVGDLWPDAPIAMGAMNYPFSQGIAKKLEKSIYKNAIGVIGLSPFIVSTIQKRTATPAYYVPNFSDTDFFKPSEKGNKNGFVITYTGALGRANGLEYLLRCAKRCEEENLPISFNIMGEGAVFEDLIKKAEFLGLSRIRFLPFGPKEEVRKILDQSDAAYISYKKLKILETGSPNKFFDAIAAGKFIILNFGGWLKDYVEMSKCGFSYDPESPDQFIEKIKHYLTDPSLLRESQNNARKLAEEEFALKIWESKFAKILLDYVNKKGSTL